MITLEQAKNLKYGQILYHLILENADGSPAKYKVIGKPKTWKRRPDRVEVSTKRGLYEYVRFNENELHNLALETHRCAHCERHIDVTEETCHHCGWIQYNCKRCDEFVGYGVKVCDYCGAHQ